MMENKEGPEIIKLAERITKKINLPNYSLDSIPSLIMKKGCILEKREIKKIWEDQLKKEKNNINLDFYVHYPYCKKRCLYCQEPGENYTKDFSCKNYPKKIIKNLEFYSSIFSERKFSNLYIGGGTPSLLTLREMEEIFSKIFKLYNFKKEGERTFEFNPKSIDLKKLRVLRKNGFNRLSMGVQTLNKEILEKSGRESIEPEKIIEILNLCKDFGFEFINVDLIMGLAEDTPEKFLESFKEILKQKPSSVTVYIQNPTEEYLKIFFKNNKSIYYEGHLKKFTKNLEILKKISEKEGYFYEHLNRNSDRYEFYKKDIALPATRYEHQYPSSCMGIGKYARSKIHEKIIYYEEDRNTSEIEKEKNNCLFIDKRLEILNHILKIFSRGEKINIKKFEKTFEVPLLEFFKEEILILEQENKIKLKKENLYLVGKKFKERFISALVFLGKKNLYSLGKELNLNIENMKRKKELKRIDIKVGYSCNNNCKFCIIGEKRKSFKDRELGEIIREIRRAKKEGFEKIVLTGGEPTIRKDFLKIVLFAKKTGFKTIHIESNGRIFKNEEFAKKTIESGANAFTISLHSSNAQDYESLTQTNGFSQTIEGIKNLRKFTKRIGINCTITKINFKKLKEIIKICADLGLESINFPYLNSSGNAKEFSEEIFVNLSEIKPFLKEALEFAKRKKIVATTEMVPICCLPGNEESCFELYKKEHEISAIDYLDKDFIEGIKKGRIKSKKCKECLYDKVCFGIVPDSKKEENLKCLEPIRKKEKKKDNILILNEDCNLNCFFCPITPSKKEKITLKQAKKVIKKLYKNNKEKIILTGGEPLISKIDLEELINFCKKTGFKEIILQTNGILLNEKKIKKLKESGLSQILISTHSSKKERYLKITGSDNLEKVLKNMGAINKEGIPLNLSYVINLYNYENILEDIKFFQKKYKINIFEIGYTYKFNQIKEFKMIKFSLFKKDFLKALKYLRSKNEKFLIAYCGIPLCFLEGFEEYSTWLFNKIKKEEYSLEEMDKNFVKTKKCKECSLKGYCYGIPKEYFKIYGDKEITPSNKDINKIISRREKIKKKTIYA